MIEVLTAGTVHVFSCGDYRLEGFVTRGRMETTADLIRLVRAAVNFNDDPEPCLVCKRKAAKSK